MLAGKALNFEDAVEKTWDALVVGAGTGGSPSARKLAEKGLETILIDKKDLKSIGDKVCGDAVGAHHFKKTGIAPPSGRELSNVYEGIRIFSPDLKSVFTVEGSGYSVNRYFFGQRLLTEAIDAGAYILPSTTVLDVVVEENKLSGLIVRARNGKTAKLKGKIVIDASGWMGSVRSKVAGKMGVEKQFSKNDLAFCYREIRDLSKRYDPSKYAEIFLDVEIAPGGYWWVFPKEKGKQVNVGIGTQMSSRRNPRKLYEKHILKLEYMRNSKLVDGRAGIVPTRRPINTMVWNGLIIVGDAASTANPLHGGGIGHSMFSGMLAGEVGSDAVLEGDVSADRLWEFNLRYMKADGAKNAKLDVFRIFLQKVENEEINFGMKAKLVDESALSTLRIEEAEEFTLKQKLEKVLKAIGKPSLLRKLIHVKRVMREVKELYLNYPDSRDKFEKWDLKVNKLFNSYASELRP